MLASKLRQIIVAYNRGRPRYVADHGRSECSQDEFDMLQVIIEDLESYGFTDFRYDGSRAEWRGFILCNYGPMICGVDISTADRHRVDIMDPYAELVYLRDIPEYTLTPGRRTTRLSAVQLCRWGWAASGAAFRMRAMQLHKLLIA